MRVLGFQATETTPANLTIKWNLLEGEGLVDRIEGSGDVPDLAKSRDEASPVWSRKGL